MIHQPFCVTKGIARKWLREKLAFEIFEDKAFTAKIVEELNLAYID